MIRTADKLLFEEKTDHMDGNGHLVIRHMLISPDEMLQKGRVFAHSTLEPGASIGYHMHEGESEIYYIYSGRGEINDNGEIKPIKAGDTIITQNGQGHSIKNTSDEALHFIALILYE